MGNESAMAARCRQPGATTNDGSVNGRAARWTAFPAGER